MKKIIFLVICCLVMASLVFGAVGDQTQFGNATDTTCWVGGDIGVANCTTDFCIVGGNCLSTASNTFNTTSDMQSAVWDTITNAKWCKYTAATDRIDCDVEPVVDTNTYNTSAQMVSAVSPVLVGNISAVHTLILGNVSYNTSAQMVSAVENKENLNLKQVDFSELVNIAQDGTPPSIQVTQTGSTSASGKGAIDIINTGNPGVSFRSYTNEGATAIRDANLFNCDNTAFDTDCIDVQNDGTGYTTRFRNPAGTGDGVFVDMDIDGIGLNIDSEATTSTNYGLQVVASEGANPSYIATSSSDYYLKRKVNDGASNYFYRDLDSASTNAPIVRIENRNVGDDQSPFQIIDYSGGNGLLIDENHDTRALNIDSNATSAVAAGIDVNMESTADGISIDVNGGRGIRVTQEGAGIGVFVDQDGDEHGIEIDSEATTEANRGLQVVTGQGATGALISYGTAGNGKVEFAMNPNNGNEASHYFFRDLASASTDTPVVLIEQDNAGDDQVALTVQQDSATAAAIKLTGSNQSITGVDCIHFNSGGMICSGS